MNNALSRQLLITFAAVIGLIALAAGVAVWFTWTSQRDYQALYHDTQGAGELGKADSALWQLRYSLAMAAHADAAGLKRAADHVGAGGASKNASFRRVDARARRTDEPWTFQQNPFLGTKELSGLVVLMNLINNWDIDKALNNRVLFSTPAVCPSERWFVVSYLGVCVAAYVAATRWQDCAAKHGPDRCDGWGREVP